MTEWGFLTNHARVLLHIARDPDARLRDIAASLGITERRAHGIITDLAKAGYVITQKDGRRNRYQIQAHLAAAHSTAPSWQETDWDRIVGLYDLLGSITASPVVALNRAVAVTERDGPKAGLAALKTIVGLEYSHLWHAALADNLRRLGHTSEAAGELHSAVTLAPSEVEQRLLQGRLRTVRSELG